MSFKTSGNNGLTSLPEDIALIIDVIISFYIVVDLAFANPSRHSFISSFIIAYSFASLLLGTVIKIEKDDVKNSFHY